MELEILQQRLLRYPEAKLTYGTPPNEYSYIEYQGVILRNKRYGPLWKLFKRYYDDKILESDLDDIEIIDYEEIPEEIEEDSPHQDLAADFRTNMGRNIHVKYYLYNKHTSEVKGSIRDVTDKMVVLVTTKVLRYIDYESIIEYKYIR